MYNKTFCTDCSDIDAHGPSLSDFAFSMDCVCTGVFSLLMRSYGMHSSDCWCGIQETTPLYLHLKKEDSVQLSILYFIILRITRSALCKELVNVTQNLKQLNEIQKNSRIHERFKSTGSSTIIFVKS
jgi:hypothetical protein